jgi:hypothetical protein
VLASDVLVGWLDLEHGQGVSADDMSAFLRHRAQ